MTQMGKKQKHKKCKEREKHYTNEEFFTKSKKTGNENTYVPLLTF